LIKAVADLIRKGGAMKETLKPGLVVTVFVKLIEVDRRRLVFEVSASDGIDVVSKGIHERFVIDAQKFTEKLSEKTSQEVSS
jgi:fluoroacetyl-CoA thioesterase